MRQATEANIFNTANSLAIDPISHKVVRTFVRGAVVTSKLSSRVKI